MSIVQPEHREALRAQQPRGQRYQPGDQARDRGVQPLGDKEGHGDLGEQVSRRSSL